MDKRIKRAWGKRLVVVLLAFGFITGPAHAIILFRTADPTANTTAPSNDPAASGWNYEGTFGGYLGTPIAPHFFVSAGHIGAQGNLVYQGVTYTVVTNFHDPFSDLNIWQVNETFPTFAPLYTKNDERGQRLVAIGRGTQRGSEVSVSGQPRGWYWGPGDGVQRWGENLVLDIVNFSSGPNDAIYATFDQNGLPDECHFSSGDSGGAVFIQDAVVWKLAGINYAVDGDFYTDAQGDGKFDAALFDMGGFYFSNDQPPPAYLLIPPNTPSGFYVTRISSKLAWIYSVIDPTGDADGNGRSNLLDYALALNAPVPQGYGGPTLTQNGSSLTITYRKINDAPDLSFVVEQCTDLVSWVPAAVSNQVTNTNGNVSTVAATVDTGSATTMFLHLKITQSSGMVPAPAASDVALKRQSGSDRPASGSIRIREGNAAARHPYVLDDPRERRQP